MRRKSDDLEPVVINAFKHFLVVLLIAFLFSLIFVCVTTNVHSYWAKRIFVFGVVKALLRTFLSVLMGYPFLVVFISENRYLINVVCYLWSFIWGLNVLVACRNVYYDIAFLSFKTFSQSTVSRLELVIIFLLSAYFIVGYGFCLYKRKLIRTQAKQNN